MQRSRLGLRVFGLLAMGSLCVLQQAQVSGADKLITAAGGKTSAVVCVDAEAGKASDAKGRRGRKAILRRWERRAADDLAKYIELMTGAQPKVLDAPAAVDGALKSGPPCFLVGELALRTNPKLKTKLNAVAKKNPTIRADAIVAVRDGNRVYLAGTNDMSHYHAVAWLLREWGCRWYLPTEIGECVPQHDELSLGSLDHAYASPFEMRGYWISWNGSGEGAQDFRIRNFMNSQGFAGSGHALGGYTKDLAPKGKSTFNVPFADPKTAEHIVAKMAKKMEQRPAGGISLAISDGTYTNDNPDDNRLKANLSDKYFLKPAMTDPMMALYGNVGRLLDEKHPGNPTRFGGMAYANVTLPPQWKQEISDRLVIWLAPIDVDPNHGWNDPDSPPRQEYGEMLRRWAELMDGRICIYDYDQGMLVWRDIPNPSHFAFKEDVKLYRDSKIIGVNTESRNAIATTFLNLHLRGQLLWNPDADLDALLSEFYPTFYGPAAAPMRGFWEAIFRAWGETVVTEHEYFAAPAIYTRELMAGLAQHIKAANQAIAVLEKKSARTRDEELYVKRMEMARRQWAVLDLYMRMVFAAATEVDYARAADLGRQAMAARLKLAEMNRTFTTRVVGPAAEPREPKGSPAWFPGEVKQYIDLATLTTGEKGTLVQKLPLVWAFRRDPNDTGLPRGWAYKDADLTYWNAHQAEYDVRSRKDYPITEWELLRTDLYAQAQGIRHPDAQSFTGHLWYKTKTDLKAADVQGNVHIRFPGLFNECWLYVNGFLVAHRPFNAVWWYTNYSFNWDVDLTGKLKAGENDITLRGYNPHHFGGMFRRPFLYRPTGK